MLDEKDLYNQLVLRPEYRAYTNKQRAELIRKEPTPQELKDLAGKMCELWANIKHQSIEGVKAIGGKDAEKGWNNFEINGGTGKGSEGKGYLTFENVQKDLSSDSFLAFIQRLQKERYNGQIKTGEVAYQFRFRFDNVVFHGRTEKDVELAMRIAKEMFGDKLSQTQVGKDGANKEGKHKSHTDLLAEEVLERRKKKYNVT